MDAQLVAFIGVAAALAAAPGPDMALVTRNALAVGFGAAACTIAGIVVGTFVWAVAAAIGLAALVARSPELFRLLQLVGAGYLGYLGLRALVDSAKSLPVDPSDLPTGTRLIAFRSGLLTNLLNPKVGIFYTTLLPAFIRPEDDPFLRPLLLASIHAVLGVVFLLLVARIAVRSSETLRRPAARRWMLRFSGVALLGLGLRVALDRR